MKRYLVIALPLVALLVFGCSGPACLQQQPYMRAQAFPPLRAAADLHVPKPNPTMQIPRVASGPVGAVKDAAADNKFGKRCLAMPPHLSISQEKAPATSSGS